MNTNEMAKQSFGTQLRKKNHSDCRHFLSIPGSTLPNSAVIERNRSGEQVIQATKMIPSKEKCISFGTV